MKDGDGEGTINETATFQDLIGMTRSRKQALGEARSQHPKADRRNMRASMRKSILHETVADKPKRMDSSALLRPSKCPK
jgi:hypothetical protein